MRALKFAFKFYELAASRNPVLLLSKALLKFSSRNSPFRISPFKIWALKILRLKLRFETERLKFYGSNSPLKPRGKQDAIYRRACRIIAHRQSRVNFGKFHPAPTLNLRLKFRRLSFAAKSIRRFSF